MLRLVHAFVFRQRSAGLRVEHRQCIAERKHTHTQPLSSMCNHTTMHTHTQTYRRLQTPYVQEEQQREYALRIRGECLCVQKYRAGTTCLLAVVVVVVRQESHTSNSASVSAIKTESFNAQRGKTVYLVPRHTSVTFLTYIPHEVLSTISPNLTKQSCYSSLTQHAHRTRTLASIVLPLCSLQIMAAPTPRLFENFTICQRWHDVWSIQYWFRLRVSWCW